VFVLLVVATELEAECDRWHSAQSAVGPYCENPSSARNAFAHTMLNAAFTLASTSASIDHRWLHLAFAEVCWTFAVLCLPIDMQAPTRWGLEATWTAYAASAHEKSSITASRWPLLDGEHVSPMCRAPLRYRITLFSVCQSFSVQFSLCVAGRATNRIVLWWLLYS
jgi:hypothetical protein